MLLVTGQPSAEKSAPWGAKPLEASRAPVPTIRRTMPPPAKGLWVLALVYVVAFCIMGAAGFALVDIVRHAWR
jgi:hypothetical protein